MSCCLLDLCAAGGWAGCVASWRCWAGEHAGFAGRCLLCGAELTGVGLQLLPATSSCKLQDAGSRVLASHPLPTPPCLPACPAHTCRPGLLPQFFLTIGTIFLGAYVAVKVFGVDVAGITGSGNYGGSGGGGSSGRGSGASRPSERG